MQTRLVGYPQMSLYCLQQMGAEGSRTDAREVEGVGGGAGVRSTLLEPRRPASPEEDQNPLFPVTTPYKCMFIEGEGVT